MDRDALLFRIRAWMVVFLVGLVLSGLTAFPLLLEVRLIARTLGLAPDADPTAYTGLRHWIAYVQQGLTHAHTHYPFLAYGTDWLAFGHLAIAVLMLGVLRDPVRNVWLLQGGLILCVGVLPIALICGPLRGIPFAWQLFDCSFGLLGAIPLLVCLRLTRKLERLSS